MTEPGPRARRLLLSRVAVVVFALVSAYYNLSTLSLMWSPHGFIGIYMDGSTALVSGLEPWLEKAGVQPGDRTASTLLPCRFASAAIFTKRSRNRRARG